MDHVHEMYDLPETASPKEPSISYPTSIIHDSQTICQTPGQALRPTNQQVDASLDRVARFSASWITDDGRRSQVRRKLGNDTYNFMEW